MKGKARTHSVWRSHRGYTDWGHGNEYKDIAMDFAEGEKLVGIEFFCASRHFKKTESPGIELKDILPLVVTA